MPNVQARNCGPGREPTRKFQEPSTREKFLKLDSSGPWITVPIEHNNWKFFIVSQLPILYDALFSNFIIPVHLRLLFECMTGWHFDIPMSPLMFYSGFYFGIHIQDGSKSESTLSRHVH